MTDVGVFIFAAAITYHKRHGSHLWVNVRNETQFSKLISNSADGYLSYQLIINKLNSLSLGKADQCQFRFTTEKLRSKQSDQLKIDWVNNSVLHVFSEEITALSFISLGCLLFCRPFSPSDPDEKISSFRHDIQKLHILGAFFDWKLLLVLSQLLYSKYFTTDQPISTAATWLLSTLCARWAGLIVQTLLEAETHRGNSYRHKAVWNWNMPLYFHQKSMYTILPFPKNKQRTVVKYSKCSLPYVTGEG